MTTRAQLLASLEKDPTQETTNPRARFTGATRWAAYYLITEAFDREVLSARDPRTGERVPACPEERDLSQRFALSAIKLMGLEDAPQGRDIVQAMSTRQLVAWLAGELDRPTRAEALGFFRQLAADPNASAGLTDMANKAQDARLERARRANPTTPKRRG